MNHRADRHGILSQRVLGSGEQGQALPSNDTEPDHRGEDDQGDRRWYTYPFAHLDKGRNLEEGQGNGSEENGNSQRGSVPDSLALSALRERPDRESVFTKKRGRETTPVGRFSGCLISCSEQTLAIRAVAIVANLS